MFTFTEANQWVSLQVGSAYTSIRTITNGIVGAPPQIAGVFRRLSVWVVAAYSRIRPIVNIIVGRPPFWAVMFWTLFTVFNALLYALPLSVTRLLFPSDWRPIIDSNRGMFFLIHDPVIIPYGAPVPYTPIPLALFVTYVRIVSFWGYIRSIYAVLRCIWWKWPQIQDWFRSIQEDIEDKVGEIKVAWFMYKCRITPSFHYGDAYRNARLCPLAYRITEQEDFTYFGGEVWFAPEDFYNVMRTIDSFLGDRLECLRPVAPRCILAPYFIRAKWSFMRPHSEHLDIDVDSKYKKEKRGEEKDRARRERYESRKQKKLQEKKRREGIRKALTMHPHMDNLNDENPEDTPTPIRHLINMLEESQHQFGSDNVVFAAKVISRIVSFVGKLSLCTSWSNTITVFTTLVLDNVKSEYVVDLLLNSGNSRAAEATMEAHWKFDAGKWYSSINELRNNTSALKETPGYKVLKKSIIILVATGVIEHSKLDESRVGMLLTDIYGKFDRQKDISDLVLTDAVLEVMEYSFAAVHAAQQGNNLYSFLLPKSATAKLAQYASWLHAYRQGNIEDVSGMSPEEYVAEVTKLRMELETILSQSDIKGSMRVMHFQNYKAAVKLEADLAAFQYGSQFRVQPMCAFVFGAPGAGKSNIMMQLHAIAMVALGLPFSMKDIWNMNEGDEFDPELRNDHACFTADDIGNIKDGNIDPRTTIIAKILHIVNNVPYMSVQAALEDKGKIFYSCLSLVASTNVIGGGIERVTKLIEPYDRRILHIEAEPLEPYRKSDGSLDKEAVRAAGRDNVVTHRLRFFRIFLQGNCVRRHDIGPWMETPEFYRVYAEICRRHFVEQRGYVMKQNLQFNMERCPSCGQAPGTVHCTCTEFEISRARTVCERMGNTCVRDAVIPTSVVEIDDLTEDRLVPVMEPHMMRSMESLGNQNMDVVLGWVCDHERFYWFMSWMFRFGFRNFAWFRAWVLRGVPPSIRLPNFRIGERLVQGYNYVTMHLAYLQIMAATRGSVRDIGALFAATTFASSVHWYMCSTVLLFFPIPGVLFRFATIWSFLSWTAHNQDRYSRAILAFRQGRRIALDQGINPIPIGFCVVLLLYRIYRTVRNETQQLPTPEDHPEVVITPIDDGEDEDPLEPPRMMPHTILPDNMDDVKERRAEIDYWTSTFRDPLPARMELSSMTLDQVSTVVARNLCRVSVSIDKEAEKCSQGQGLFVTPGLVIFPDHMGSRKMYNVHGFREPRTKGKPNHTEFRATIYNRRKIEPDFAIFNTTRNQPLRNLVKFFPEQPLPPGSTFAAVMITQRDDGYHSQNVFWKTQRVGHLGTVEPVFGQGSYYSTKYNMVAGDCMSPIISRDVPHVFLGFHMGGDDNRENMAFTILQSDIVKHVGRNPEPIPLEEFVRLGLKDEPKISIPPAPKEPPDSLEGEKKLKPHMEAIPEDYPTDVTTDSDQDFGHIYQGYAWDSFTTGNVCRDWLGVDNIHAATGRKVVELECPIHERSCVNYLQYDYAVPPDMNLLGFDPSTIVHPKTQVEPTPISKYLAEEGFHNKWSGPNFRSGRDHSMYLQLGTRCIDPLNPNVLEMACKDWVFGVCEELDRIGYPRDQGPISLHEALNGVPGDRFIKPVDETTAAGPRFDKKKKQHLEVKFEDDEGNEVEEGKGRKVLYASDYLKETISEGIKNLSEGKFSSMFVKSSLKDEPAKIKEDGTTKIRIFGVLSMDMLLIGKILFAAVVTAILGIPTVSEQAQGINVVGPDWTEFANYVLFFEPDQIGEGDYSKYDTSMSGQLIRAVGDCLINVARFLGYPNWALEAMACYMESVALNAWIFNGAIFVVDGWQPSGNWLTAVIGGNGNSLLHRMCFYQYMRAFVPFRYYVHLAVLGDDSLFSSNVRWFNCCTIQKYFASIQMKYTPASKVGKIKPFVPWYEATFGKRTWRWEQKFNCFVAPLDIDSIFKSLHNRMASKTDPITTTVGVVNQALMEMARHGPTEFYRFQSLMRRVCTRADIDHMVENLRKSYDDILAIQFERQFCVGPRLVDFSDSTAMERTILQNGEEV